MNTLVTKVRRLVLLLLFALPAVAAGQPGKLPRALATVQIALKQVKGKAAIVLAAAKRPAVAPVKLAARILPAKHSDRVGQAAPLQLANKSSVNKPSGNKTVVAKAAPKPVNASLKRTRVASAR